MKKAIALVLAMLFAAVAAAQVPMPEDAVAKEPRDLGNAAVMHVYWYAPKTLEITHVESYLFKDEDACREAVGKAAVIATPHASDGDLVNVQCVGMHPPKHDPEPAPTAPKAAT